MGRLFFFGISTPTFSDQLTLTYVLYVDGNKVGDIVLKVSDLSVVDGIDVVRLKAGLGRLDADITTLEAHYPDREWVLTDELEAVGFIVQVDHDKRLLIVRSPSDIKQPRALSLETSGRTFPLETIDSQFSFWINSDLTQAVNSSQKSWILNPVVNWKSWVLQLQANRDLALGTTQLTFVNLSKSMYEDHFLISAGDLAYPMMGNQTFVPLVGVGISKGYPTAIFGEQENAIFSKQIQVLSPSLLTVYVNSQQVYSETLAVGTYDLSHLPIGYGYNRIEIRIQDGFGQVRTIEGAYFAGSSLVPVNEAYYTLNVGRIGTFAQLTFPDYVSPGVGYSFHGKYGFTDDWTVGLFGQDDATKNLWGLTVFWGLPWAVFSYTLGHIEARGFPETQYYDVQLESYALPPDFLVQRLTLGVSATSALNADHLRSIYGIGQWGQEDWFGHLTVRYVNDPIQAQNNTEAAVSVTRILNSQFRTSLEWGVYHNVLFSREWRLLLGFSWTDSAQSVSYRHDVLSAQRAVQVDVNGIPDWQHALLFNQQRSIGQSASYTTLYSPDVNQQFFANVTSVSDASVLQTGFTLRHLTPMAEFSGSYADINSLASGTVRLRSALLYADGMMGISRPIQSNFILVGHPDGRPVRTVKSNVTMYPTVLGHAMILNVPMHRIVPLYFVDLVSEGTHFKNKDVSIRPRPFKGYKIALETEALMVVSGHLVSAMGGVLADTYGELTRLDGSPGSVLFLSDAGGHFEIMSISSGRYRLTFPFAAYVPVELEIPPTSQSSYDIGDIVVQTGAP